MISKAIVPSSRHILALFIEGPDTSVKVLEKSLVKNGSNQLTVNVFLDKEEKEKKNGKEGISIKWNMK